MRILVYTDCHFSQYSSIIRSRGEKYSTRLENLIASLNWAESLVDKYKCDRVVCLGDFFDAPVLNSEELTALRDINWSGVKHYFIVGNHESNTIDLKHNSTNSLNLNNFEIISSPQLETIFGAHLIFLPYIVEEDRKTLRDYIKELHSREVGMFTTQEVKNTVVFSHNDIKGIRYGKFESTEGFDISEIENSCHMFLNGHLHNCNFLNESETVLNVGNLTGQNFSEDAYEYNHFACILDTDTLQLEFYENPFAFNFYKIDINKESDIKKLAQLKNNAVVTIKCTEYLLNAVKEAVKNSSIIKEHRIVITPSEGGIEGEVTVTLNEIDHLKQFNDFVIDKLGNTEIIRDELNKIIGG